MAERLSSRRIKKKTASGGVTPRDLAELKALIRDGERVYKRVRIFFDKIETKKTLEKIHGLV